MGAKAPVNATWALENRSVAIWVKGLAGVGQHTQNRVPCSASNPYLVGAATIAAGLDGLRNRIEPPPATEGSPIASRAHADPDPVETAPDALEKDTSIRELLREELIRLFLAVKRHEIAKATEHARDYSVDAWTSLFEFL